MRPWFVASREDRNNPMSDPERGHRYAASAIPLVREDFGRPWHWLTVFAGLLMVIAFFVPVTGQKFNFGKQVGPDKFRYHGPTDPDDLPDVPFLMWRAMVGQLASVPISWWPGNFPNLVSLALACGLPHLWGLAMLAYSLAKLGRRERVQQVIQVVTLISSLLTAIGLVAFINYSSFATTAPTFTPDEIIFYTLSTLFAVLPALYAILAVRQGPWSYLYHGFVAATTAVLILTFVELIIQFAGVPQPRRLNGLLLAFVASILLLVGRVGEARAISRLSWLRTGLWLVALRLHRKSLPLGHCPRCGYNLFGLPEARCPECGRPFRPDELGASSVTANMETPASAVRNSVRAN